MENKCCSKLPVLVSILALVVAIFAYVYPKKTESVCPCSSSDEKTKSLVISVIRDNPQLVMDAMGEGMAKKREDTLKELSSDIAKNKETLLKMGMKFGNTSSKTSIVAFVDPLCKHCIEFQKDIVKLVQAKKDVAFTLLPVAVLGEDSITLAKVYYAVYEKNSEKALAFIEAVVNSKDNMDKDGIEKALKTVGLSSKEIDSLLADADQKVIANGKKAEDLRIPIVPAVFCVVGKESYMIQNPNMDAVLKIIETGSDENSAPSKESGDKKGQGA